MRMECVVCHSLIFRPMQPLGLLRPQSVCCVHHVVEECYAYSDTFASGCGRRTDVAVAEGEFCCSQLSVRHIPSLVCSAAHDASIMLTKEGGVINTHLLPARCDEGSMRRGEIYIIRKNMNKGDRGAKWS